MTECLNNVGCPPSLSQNTITCFRVRGRFLKASQLSSAETRTGCQWLLSTPRWQVRKSEIYSHKSFRSKVNLQLIGNLRKIQKTRIKVLWCTEKSNWTSSQSWILILAPSNRTQASPSTSLMNWPDGTWWSAAVFQLWSKYFRCKEGGDLPDCNYILMSITYSVLISNWVIWRYWCLKILRLGLGWKSSHI